VTEHDIRGVPLLCLQDYIAFNALVIVVSLVVVFM